jgi:excisionase family DNA binding protein
MDTPPSPRTCGVCDEPLRGDERGRHRRCKREVRANRPGPDGKPDANKSLSSVSLPALLTVNQVADALQLSRSKVYELVASGDLDAYRPGGRLRIPAEAVVKLLDRSRV